MIPICAFDNQHGSGSEQHRHPSLVSAGELLRSRSREGHEIGGVPAQEFTAAGRPRRTTEQSLAELMTQQAALLQEQTMLLRQQSTTFHEVEDTYVDPKRILDSLDPTLRAAMSKWRTDFSKDLNQFATQRELHDKYELIRTNGEIMKQFAEESRRKWQWPKAYEAVAQPIISIEDVPIDDDNPYDSNAAWASLRKKQALECQDFIMQHQKQDLALFEEKISVAYVKQQIEDLWTSWRDNFATLHSQASLSRSKRMCQLLAQMVMREEIPNMKGRLQHAAETRNKREAAVIAAETRYQQMDPQQLIALLQLDKQAVHVKKGGINTKQVTITQGSELAILVKQFPDLKEIFRHQIS